MPLRVCPVTVVPHHNVRDHQGIRITYVFWETNRANTPAENTVEGRRSSPVEILVRLPRLERGTSPRLEGRCAIQLSYGRVVGMLMESRRVGTASTAMLLNQIAQGSDLHGIDACPDSSGFTRDSSRHVLGIQRSTHQQVHRGHVSRTLPIGDVYGRNRSR